MVARGFKGADLATILFAVPLLIASVVLGPNLIMGGVLQRLSGVIIMGHAVAFTLPFAVLSIAATWFAVVMFRTAKT